MDQNFNNQTQYTQPQQYNMTQHIQPQPKSRDNGAFGMGIASLALGIASIVFFWIGVVFGIPGIVLGSISKKREPENNNMANIGFILSIVGVALNIVCAFVVLSLIIWGVSELSSVYI